MKTNVAHGTTVGGPESYIARRIARRVAMLAFILRTGRIMPFISFWRALRLCNKGRHADAVPLLRALLVHDSELLRVRETLGQVLAYLGQVEEAQAVNSTALADDPGDVQAWLRLGRTTLPKHVSPAGTLHHSGSDGKAFNPDRPWEAYNPTQVREQLAQGSRSYAAHLSFLKEQIAELRSSNLEWALLIAIQESRLGFLDSHNAVATYSHTQQYMRNLALYRERFGAQPHPLSAVSEIPESLLPGFTMSGRIPIKSAYLNAVYPNQYVDSVTDHDIQGHSQMIMQQLGPQVRPSFLTMPDGRSEEGPLSPQAVQAYACIYGQTDSWLVHALEKHAVTGTMAVYGSVNCCHETLGLMAGVQPTTIRHRPVINRTSRIATMTVAEWEANPVSFDSALAISCLEHEGLGMYGEPLDPDADVEAMRRLKRMVRPGGLLFVAVPIGKDCVMFNSTRVYGRLRLPVLFEGWTVVARHGCDEMLFESSGEVQPVFVLRNG